VFFGQHFKKLKFKEEKEMYLLQLKEEEKNILLNFLSRLDLKGNEAFVFCDLVHKIQNLKKIEQQEDKNVQQTT
jgi:hypothetical protein